MPPAVGQSGEKIFLWEAGMECVGLQEKNCYGLERIKEPSRKLKREVVF